MTVRAERAPAVSVVIAAFDAEAHIGEAIESVLAQTLPAAELIVVDDGSSDGTAEIARAYEGVEVFSQTNAGPSAARNAGVARSTGEFIAFVDADDRMTPQRLELQVRHIEQNPDVEVVFGRQDIRVEPGADLPYWVEGSDLASLTIGPADIERVYHMSMLFRRSTWERVGPFDETMRIAEDLDWTLRANELGAGMAMIPDVVTLRRVHEGNATHDAAATREATFIAFRKRIERNRGRR